MKKKKVDNEIKFRASYNHAHQCVKVFGDGAAEIKFDTDATQLAKVLSSLATFKDSTFEVVLRKVLNGQQNSKKKRTKTYR